MTPTQSTAGASRRYGAARCAMVGLVEKARLVTNPRTFRWQLYVDTLRSRVSMRIYSAEARAELFTMLAAAWPHRSVVLLLRTGRGDWYASMSGDPARYLSLPLSALSDAPTTVRPQ
jgi:hypothetical protein